MSVTTLDQPIRSEKLKKIFDLISQGLFEVAKSQLTQAIEEAVLAKDHVMEALFYSSLGVLYKLKHDYKTAWRHYEKAEKILPHDPSLKLITARLLVENFSQSDSAIKKAKKVLELVPPDPTYYHQAQTIMGLAYLKKGDKKRALECLKDAMKDNFLGLPGAGNLDFKLIEDLLRKNVGLDECKTYLEKALALAKQRGEKKEEAVIKKLLEALLQMNPSTPTS